MCNVIAAWIGFNGDVTELCLGYWWLFLAGTLLFFSCVKHTLMSWEARQDKRRLRSCHMRCCRMRQAVKERQQQQQQRRPSSVENGSSEDLAHEQQQSGASPLSDHATGHILPPASPFTDAQVHLPTNAEATGPQHEGAQADMHEDRDACAALSSADTRPKTPLPPPPPSHHTHRTSSASTLRINDDDTRQPSLHLSLTSSSSSDLSFSMSPKSVTQQAVDATSRLFNRLSVSPGSLDVSPANSDLKTASFTSADALLRRSGCCPRYSEDEKRLIDEKRLENAQAWMDAKRALESTETLASCGVSPASSATHRKVGVESAGSLGDDAS